MSKVQHGARSDKHLAIYRRVDANQVVTMGEEQSNGWFRRTVLDERKDGRVQIRKGWRKSDLHAGFKAVCEFIMVDGFDRLQ